MKASSAVFIYWAIKVFASQDMKHDSHCYEFWDITVKVLTLQKQSVVWDKLFKFNALIKLQYFKNSYTILEFIGSKTLTC